MAGSGNCAGGKPPAPKAGYDDATLVEALLVYGLLGARRLHGGMARDAMALKFEPWNSTQSADLEQSLADHTVVMLSEEPTKPAPRRSSLVIPPSSAGRVSPIKAAVVSSSVAQPSNHEPPAEPWTEAQELEWHKGLHADLVSGREFELESCAPQAVR